MSRKAIKQEVVKPVRKVIKKEIEQPEIQEFIAFWSPNDPHPHFGQWYESDFVLTQEICDRLPEEIKNLSLCRNRIDVIQMLMNGQNNEVYGTAEKFMMMGKAALFRDANIFRQMTNTNSPKEHKRLGRLVQNFNGATWDAYCCDIVKIGNYLKFSQNDELAQLLKQTNNAILVEGSPLDKIWGVGLRFDHPDIQHMDRWKGTNYLGICLMFVRDII